MNSAPDHLYEDGNTTGYRRTQTKSILKNRENMTMPNPSMPIRHFDAASRLANRRVSFANKVKLHKIDFVPSNEAGDDMAEDGYAEEYSQSSSDIEDEEPNVSALEREALGFLASLRNPPHDNSSDDEDLPQSENVLGRSKDDDQTMEFTGLNTRSQEQEMDFTDQLNGEHKTSLSSPFIEHQNHLDRHLNSMTEANSAMDVTMEFTKNVSSFAVISNNDEGEYSLAKSGFQDNDSDANGKDDSTMDFTKLFNEVSSHGLYNFSGLTRLSFHETQNERLDTNSNELGDNSTMQLTQQLNPIVEAGLPREGHPSDDDHSSSINLNQDNKKTEEDSEANTGVSTTNEVKVSVIDNADGHENHDEEEQTMQLTTQLTITNPQPETLPNSANGTSVDNGTGKLQTSVAIDQRDTEHFDKNNEIESDDRDKETEKGTSVKDLPEAAIENLISDPIVEPFEESVHATLDQPCDEPASKHSEMPELDNSQQLANNTTTGPIRKERISNGDPPNASHNDLNAATFQAQDHQSSMEKEAYSPKSVPVDGSPKRLAEDLSLHAKELQVEQLSSPQDSAYSDTIANDIHANLDARQEQVEIAGKQEDLAEDLAEDLTKEADQVPELSQPMELTQSRSEIRDFSVKNELPMKRLAEGFEEPSTKHPHSVTRVSTLDIPLAETSTLSADGVDEDFDDPNYQPVKLSTFLDDIGVKFYDDLEIATDTANRYSLSMMDRKADFGDEDYYKGNVHLPLLEVLEMSCKELTQKIQQGKELFEEITEQALRDNPLLLKQFYQSTYYDQISMKSLFHQMKEYTRHQAKQVWYEWRTQLMQNVLEVQQGNIEILQSDKSILEESILNLKLTQATLREQLQQLRVDLSTFKEIRASYNDLDSDQLKNIKLQLMDLNQKLLDHRDEISKRELRLIQIQHDLDEANVEIAKRRENLNQVENQLSRRKIFTESEIKSLEDEVERFQEEKGFEYRSGIGTDTIKLDFYSCILVEIQFDDGNPTNVQFENKGPVTGKLAFAELAQLATASLPIKGLTPSENLTQLKERWEKVEQIDRDLFKLSLKYPFKLLIDEQGFKAVFTVFSFASGAESQYTLEFHDNDVTNYPDRVAVTVTEGKRLKGKAAEIARFKGLSRDLTAKLQTNAYD